jgi:mannose-6-phosphate isomerase-like protein (cupin superfamily)
VSRWLVSEKDTMKYRDVVVRKPWGYEYLMHQNENVGVWYLSIRYGERTSLHCHPKKKTGLVLLTGEAEVSFLNGAVSLKSLGKLMIRAGLFHSTTALSPQGITLIEIETPFDKADLVRFEDEYGRKERPYEGPEAMVPLTENCIRFEPPEENGCSTHRVGSCVLSMEKTRDIGRLRDRPSREIVAVLAGGLVSSGGEFVLGPGDVVSTDTLSRLASTFSAPEAISILTVHENTNGGE